MNRLIAILGWFAAPTLLVMVLVVGVFIASPTTFVLKMEDVAVPDRNRLAPLPTATLTTSRRRAFLIEYDQRPLFSQNRKPPLVVEDGAVLIPLTFDVVGITVSASDAVAVLRRRNNKQLRVGAGDEVDGWRVSSIHSKGVIFERAGEVRDISLVRLGE